MNVHAPIVNALTAEISLHPLRQGDRFRLRRWLSEPHVIQWWGSRAAAEAAIALAAISHTALARMVVRRDQAIGYAHAIELEDPCLSAATWLADVFIGMTEYRGQGLGAVALEQLRDELFATTLASALAVRVSIRNEQQVRAIERAGFKWHGVAPDALLGPCWLMVANRPSTDAQRPLLR